MNRIWWLNSEWFILSLGKWYHRQTQAPGHPLLWAKLNISNLVMVIYRYLFFPLLCNFAWPPHFYGNGWIHLLIQNKGHTYISRQNIRGVGAQTSYNAMNSHVLEDVFLSLIPILSSSFFKLPSIYSCV